MPAPPSAAIDTAHRVLHALPANRYPARFEVIRLRRWAAPDGWRPIKEFVLEVVEAESGTEGHRDVST